MTSQFGKEFAKLTKDIEDLGFHGVLYSFYPRPMYLSSTVQPVLHYSGALAPFVAHYIENNYGNRDFVLRLALEERIKPVDWWEEIRLGGISPEERAVTEDAKQNFGIYHGLSIPVLSGSFAIAGISVISKDTSLSHFQTLKQQHKKQLFALAENYHAKMMNSKEELRFFLRPLLENLNDTQIKVLRYVMTGKPMKSILHTYGITHKYAEKVLLNIRKEFGNISTNELMYFLGMINMHEYL